MSMPTRRDCANAIRLLSVDAVQKAHSGHPGMPMGMADIATVLWQDFLQHHPEQPDWFNRDRFVLSNGHGCMLLYALLHLTGYALTIDELKQFRQLHSRTPGHPEWGVTPGVETTTGPLGQGLANAVGMAMAERHLAARFNRPGWSIIDYYTYVFVGDGCLMEGISHEVCSLAGTLGLGKLIVFYDDNGISIDGPVHQWFTDQTPQRFAAYGWHVIPQVDGHDSEQVREAILAARAVTDRPTIICCQTTIGWGAPRLAGTAKTHGAALGEAEVAAVRERLHWPHPPFVIPKEIYAAWDARAIGKKRVTVWQQQWAGYQQAYPELAAELTRRIARQLPSDWAAQAEQLLHAMQTKSAMATRQASQLCLNHYASCLPEMLGGSADLTESNCTAWEGMQVFSQAHPEGRYVHYGVREFGMSAIMNGLALSQAILPFGGTFLTFSDYARNAVRLAALMQVRVIFVYTHDSIGLGEDGPTHQPIEQLPGLRLIPHLSVWRPCDAAETAVAWRMAIERQGPTCLLLSRQTLPSQPRHAAQLVLIQRGGYVLWDPLSDLLQAIFIATGSEVALAVAAAQQLQTEGIPIRVVSMPSTDVFLAQESSYQESVLPSSVTARVAIEAAAGEGWFRWVGQTGGVIGMNHFGASAPAAAVFQDSGFSVERVVEITKEIIYSAAVTRSGQEEASSHL
jgi:transketolase